MTTFEAILLGIFCLYFINTCGSWTLTRSREIRFQNDIRNHWKKSLENDAIRKEAFEASNSNDKNYWHNLALEVMEINKLLRRIAEKVDKSG